jgi:hypothetical protein
MFERKQNDLTNNSNSDVKMDVIDDTDDDEILECEDCRFAPDLIPMHNGKYLCSVW